MNKEIINKIRGFNRFYVRIIGLLEDTILNSGYSLTEAHILNVLHTKTNSTATDINKELFIDEGYLSRVIKKLIKKSLITKKQSLQDKRAFVINLTDKGKIEYQKLDTLSSELVQSNIMHLDHEEKLELATLMDRAKVLLTQDKIS